MRRSERWTTALAVIGLSVCGAGHLFAQQPAGVPRAARLSFVQGRVQVTNPQNGQSADTQPQAADQPQAAQLNLPLMEGQRILTGDDGEAELEFEDGSVARLAPNSALALIRLDTEQNRYLTQIDVEGGLAYMELRVSGEYGYYITASGQGITPVENATFRVSLDQTPTEIAVMQGSIHVEREGGFAANVKANETLKADAQDPQRYFLSREFRKDSWDTWNEERDQQAAQELSQRTEARDQYAADTGYGWSDLDANGSWYDLPGTGRVWQPPVATDPNWDPYGYGNWVWYPGQGYVWASGYNWGWTPYRCGNWSYWDSFGWGWMPGTGCGGWGGRGGVWAVNVINPPRSWRPIARPIPGPGRVHPIIAVRNGPVRFNPATPRRGPVNFNGNTLQPLRPVGGSSVTRRASATGAPLQRDFPINRGTRQPDFGVVRTRPVDGKERPVWNPGEGQAPPPIQTPVVRPPVPAGGWRQVNPGSGQRSGQGQGRPGNNGQNNSQQPIGPPPGATPVQPRPPMRINPTDGQPQQPPRQNDRQELRPDRPVRGPMQPSGAPAQPQPTPQQTRPSGPPANAPATAPPPQRGPMPSR